MQAACNTPCEDGMVIRTNTRRVRNARKANVQLILSQHNTSCTTCVRDGNCALQDLTKELNITEPVEEADPRPFRWDRNEVLIRDDSKCIQCFRCYNECEKVQELSVWDVLGTGTGAAVIFGRTGGVMEAALRSAYYLVVGENPDPAVFGQMGPDGQNAGADRPWREAEYKVGPATVRTAVTSGLANAGKLIEALKRGEVSYDFVEIMACPGGCAGGGGQPIHDGQECAYARGGKLDALDESNSIRYSHENPDVFALYSEYLEKPLSHLSHTLLHTDQTEWSLL